MSKDIKTKERVIKYLLEQERKYANNQLLVDVGRELFSNSDIADIGEEDFIKQISILETDGLIEVKFHAGHRNLKYGITVVLRPYIINYFNNKRKWEINYRNEWIKFWIPVSISIIAIVISAIALLLELKVIQPWQQSKPEVETTDASQPNCSSDR